ncbi:MAG: hypothetical protein ACLPT4_14350 [Verrucomicrobiia bacterium]
MKYQAHGDGDKNRPQIVEITKARYEAVRKAKIACLFAIELEEKFALLMDNFAEFEFELLRIAETWLLWPNRGHADNMQERLTLDRRLVNLLTACRLYLDQTEHGISGLFGETSSELDTVKKFRRNLYDGHFGYRVMEALRNHVQHSGLLVHIISYEASRSTGKGPDYFECVVIPKASVKELSENPKLKNEILQELLTGKDEVDLRGSIREYITCLIELHDRLRDTIKVLADHGRETYQAAIEEFSKLNGQSVRFPSLVELHDDLRKHDEVVLRRTLLDRLDPLRKRNSVNKRLCHFTASNSDQEKP